MQPPAHRLCDAGFVNPSVILLRTTELSEITLPLHFSKIVVRVYDNKYKSAFEGVGFIGTPPIPIGTTNIKKYIYNNALKLGLKIKFVKESLYDHSEYTYTIVLEGFVEEHECRCSICGCNVYVNLATNETYCLNETCTKI